MKTIAPHVESSRIAHHNALLSLYSGTKPTTGLAIWRKLCQLERIAHAGATAYCNGETFHTAAESYNFSADENAWELFSCAVKARAKSILGGTLPDGFFVNGDARGFSLKLDPDKVKIPNGMQTDWGGCGILAAVIE